MDSDNKQRIDISVVVITFNQQSTIGRTLDSILRQKTDASYEIIIGDDCSQDSTPDICMQYRDKYPDIIRYIRRTENIGLVNNYFDCIQHSRGRFIADCAGDDFWIDDYKLQKEYEVLTDDSNVSLVHTDWNCCDMDGSNIRRPEIFCEVNRSCKTVWKTGEACKGILLRNLDTYIHLCTAMYRKDIIDSVMKTHPYLLISSDYTCEDLQISTVMAANGKVVYLPDITLCYSVDNESVSHNLDFTKKYYQHKGYLCLTKILSKEYGYSDLELINYFKSEIDYLSAQVYHSNSEYIWNDYNSFLRDNELNDLKRTKTKVRDFIISHKLLWVLFYQLYHKKVSI